VPGFRDKVAASLVLAPNTSLPAAALPVFEVSFYPADLIIDAGDFEQDTTPLVSSDKLSPAGDGTFQVDIGDVLDLFPALAIGFRIKLRADPDLDGFESLGVAFSAWVEVRSGAKSAKFVRGDPSDDGRVDLSDAVSLIGFLFLGGTDSVRCDDAADTDDSGSLEVTDAIAVLGYVFLGGPGPRAPFPLCNLDATGDRLSCRTYSSCGQVRP
jgi:hypothetical protein